MNCLRSLERWGRGFESHSSHGSLCAGSGLLTGWSPVQGVLQTILGLRNWNKVFHGCSMLQSGGNRKEREKEMGPRGSLVGWGIMLHVGRSRVRFPMMSLNFLIDLVLLAALWPWWTQPLTEMSTRNLPAGKERPAHKSDNLKAISEQIFQWVLGAFSPGVKRLGRETDHSFPSSVEVRNGGATPPLLGTSWRRGA
jgi:hypothetical protein